MADDRVQRILDRLEELKDDVEAAYEGLGLGRDQVVRGNDALDVAKTVIASHHPEIVASEVAEEEPAVAPVEAPVAAEQPAPVVESTPAPVAPVDQPQQ